jgi:hypothetical protein
MFRDTKDSRRSEEYKEFPCHVPTPKGKKDIKECEWVGRSLKTDCKVKSRVCPSWFRLTLGLMTPGRVSQAMKTNVSTFPSNDMDCRKGITALEGSQLSSACLSEERSVAINKNVSEKWWKTSSATNLA